MLTELLLCVRHSTCIISFHMHNSPITQVIVLHPLYNQGKRGTERSAQSHTARVRGEIWTLSIVNKASKSVNNLWTTLKHSTQVFLFPYFLIRKRALKKGRHNSSVVIVVIVFVRVRTSALHLRCIIFVNLQNNLELRVYPDPFYR